MSQRVRFQMNRVREFFKRVSRADIVKVFSLNAVSTLVRMCTGLVSTKVVASIIGPSGVALLGQLNNLNSMLQGLAAGGVGNGVTKYLAENREDGGKVKGYISNALKISAVFTTMISLVCIFGHNLLSRKVMMSDEYGYVFIVLGCTIFLFTLNTLLINILNGFKEFKKYVAINIYSSIVGLVFSVTLCLLWGLEGSMVSAVTFQSVVLFVTIFQCRKCPWFKREYFFAKYDRPIIRQYLQYTLMALTSLSIVPVTQMILRGYVISEISVTDADVTRMSIEETMAKAREGFFVRDAERNLVICPQGQTLRAKCAKKNGQVRYCNKLACKSCTAKCTTSKFKEADFPKDRLLKESKAKHNDNPDDNRKCLSEHPFGTIKRTMGEGFFLLRRMHKTEGEMALYCLAYNMRRALSILKGREQANKEAIPAIA